MNNKLVLVLIGVAIVLGAGYIAVKSMKKSIAPVPVPTPVVEQITVVPTISKAPITAAVSPTPFSSMQEITVEGNEYAFTPSTITVKKSEVVRVNFKNNGKFPHNFSIAELNVKSKTIQSGGEDTVTFTADKIGSFTYICTVPGHADKGMKGTLIVK